MSFSRTATGLLFKDDFNRANGAVGADWTVESGTWAIDTNRLKVDSPNTTTVTIRVAAGSLANRRDFHIQHRAIRTDLRTYLDFAIRRSAVGTHYQGGVRASNDGAFPNGVQSYRLLGGGATGLAGVGGAGPVANVEQRITNTVKGAAPSTELKCWVDGVAFAHTTDNSAGNDPVGTVAINAYCQAGFTVTNYINDVVICTDRTITFNGLPAGYKIRANGITSAAAVAATPLVLDLLGTVLPVTLLEVLDAGGSVIDSTAIDVWGGDTFLFVDQTVYLGAGGGQIAGVGTVLDSGLATLAGGGAGIAAVGTSTVQGSMEMTAGGGSIEGTIGNFADNPYELGRREVTADFVGHRSANISILKRPDAISFDYLSAFSMGPQAFGDASTGATDRPWYARADNALGKVFLAKANDLNTAWEAETILFSFTGAIIEEIDLAFDQSGNAVVCLERKSGVGNAKQVWLYWFKPSAGTFVLEMVEAGRTPRIVLDNPTDPTNSDVILFYLKAGVGLVYRVQRELYTPAHTTPHVVETDWYIEDAFYTRGYRVAVFMVLHNPGGTYGQKRLESTLMPVFVTDMMTFGASLEDGILRVALIIFTDDVATYPDRAGPALKDDYLVLGSAFNLGACTLAAALLLHTLYDIEELTFGSEFAAGALVDLGINFLHHELYDIDGLELGSSFNLASNTLAATLITYTMYDLEQLTFASSFGTGGTLA